MLTKEQKAKLRAEYNMVWGKDNKMVDYCVNKNATVAELPNGDIVPVEKQSIEKSFCFGESGYDYEEAQNFAHVARTSEGYFKQENMKYFNEWLFNINEQYKLHDGEHPGLPNEILLICEKPYCGRSGAFLRGARWIQWWDMLEALGGTASASDLPGLRFEQYGTPYRVPTLDELDAIKAAYEQARAEHEKKVDRYLKRYGLTKVHAWTYWRDA